MHISAKAQVPPALVQVGAEVIVPEYPELQAAAVQVPAKATVAVPLEQLYPVGAMQATAGGGCMGRRVLRNTPADRPHSAFTPVLLTDDVRI